MVLNGLRSSSRASRCLDSSYGFNLPIVEPGRHPFTQDF